MRKKEKKRTYNGNNTEGIRKKEIFARRLRRIGQGDQMTTKRDDVKEVKSESMQREGLFSRVKCYGGRSSKTKMGKCSLDLITMNLHCWQK